MLQDSSVHITSFCKIRNHKVWRNEELIYERKTEGTDILQDMYDQLTLNYPKFFKMDNLCKLGTLAAHVLLHHLRLENYQPEDIGIVLSNSNASIEADVKYYESSKAYPSPALFVYTLPNIVIGEISIRYGCKGENAFFVSGQFDARLLHFYVMDLLRHQRIKACICGWSDVVNDTMEACLFFVEVGNHNGVNFTAENIDKYYKQDLNGKE
ncbi:hypothetical protein PIECOFPK_00452 [Mycovorax composti]|uniref:Beta-ketoacyl synthase N-terminal domain-containing protein n=1 Tax=Mycovorax composti TaxID=2962693 RepID=A0ABZ2EHS5_9BACT